MGDHRPPDCQVEELALAEDLREFLAQDNKKSDPG